MNKNHNFLIPLLVSCMLLFSCMSLSDLNNGIIQEQPLPTATKFVFPATWTPISMAATPSPTPIPPSLTPLPTIPTEQYQTYVSDFMENNTCRLPCLWGITPGETTWDEARHFLDAFSITLGNSESQGGGAKVPSPIDIEYINYISYNFELDQKIVTGISFYSWPELSSWHYLSNILNNYGPPDQVGLYTEGKQYTGSRIADLFIFYADPGFMIDYVSFRELEAVGDKVMMCPEGNYAFSYLWSSDLELSYDDALLKYLDSEHLEYRHPRLLNEVSEMSIEGFYQAFQDPTNESCIETDLEAWPHFLD